MRALVEVHEHRRVAAGGDHPVRGRRRLELVAAQQLGAPGVVDAVLAIEHVAGAAIGVGHGRGARQGLDLPGSRLAVGAVADAPHDRLAEGLEFDGAAGACRDHERARPLSCNTGRTSRRRPTDAAIEHFLHRRIAGVGLPRTT